MLKKELRLNFTNLRNRLSAEEIFSSSSSILKLLENVPIWDHNYYHVFLPIKEKKEIDTYPLIELLQEKNKKVIVPKIAGVSDLEHYELQQHTRLVPNKWGIPEPTSGNRIEEELIDVVFVPLLAFDYQGHRVGYGKGYYDRFLQRCRADVMKIGLSIFGPVEIISDIEETDIALDYCITPAEIYSF